jgi:hypothetical protein
MGKQARVFLVFTPIVFFGLLLFLSLPLTATGDSLQGQSRALPQAPMLQGAVESEPNDTIETADAIAVNLTMQGRIPVTRKEDIDWYRLVIPAADVGREYRATLEESVPSGDYNLELSLYDSEGDLVDLQQSGSTDIVEWSSSVITYYLQVRAESYDVDATTDAVYDLTIVRFDQPPPTATPVPWDTCEVNDDPNGTWSPDAPPGGPCPLSVSVEYVDLNFVPYPGQPAPNDDYFTFLAKAGRTYRISTDVFNGADTEMWLLDPNNNQISYDDDGGDGAGSRIVATLGDGFYKILIRDRLVNSSPPASQTYDVLVEDVTPATSTPTTTPGPGTATVTVPPPSIPGNPDVFEPNFGFANASLIGLDAKYANLNFVPWSGTDPDTDFYKLWVTAGKLYTCETTELGTASNTNILFCKIPPGETPPVVVNDEILTRMCFAGNDDVAPFDPNDPYRSRLTYFATANDYLYIVVGQVGRERILPEEWANLNYSLRCFIDLPGTATPTPTSPYIPPPPTATSAPVVNTPVPPSPTPLRLVVRPMSTPTPPPTPLPVVTPTPELYTIEVLVYYDENENGLFESGEGISSVLARVHEALSGELLSIDYTDETGRLRFSVPAQGPVRVSVPFFGFNQVIAATNTEIQIRIAPNP